MDLENIILGILIFIVISMMIILMVGLIGSVFWYNGLTDLEKCMNDYNNYEYCKRYEIKIGE